MRSVWIFLFWGVAMSSSWAQQPQPQPLRVALAGSPPFVTKENGEDAGFAVQLWKGVATANAWKFNFQPFATTEAALEALEAGQCDVLVGNTSITSIRQQKVEFSQPFYRSGLQIMVTLPRSHAARVFSAFTEPQHIVVLGVVVGLVLLATIGIAVFERQHNPDFPKTRAAGLAESFYYVMGLVTGKSAYKGFPGVLGRLVLVGWMLASLFVVSYVTSVLASSMTAAALRGHINGPQDLADKMVGLVSGSESENYARAHNLDYAAYADLEAAVHDLIAGKVQAIVGDAPVLQYYDFTHSRVPVHEVGPIFEPVNYGFTMAPNSPLREPINFALLHLVEMGALDLLGQKYFGESFQK